MPELRLQPAKYQYRYQEIKQTKPQERIMGINQNFQRKEKQGETPEQEGDEITSTQARGGKQQRTAANSTNRRTTASEREEADASARTRTARGHKTRKADNN